MVDGKIIMYDENTNETCLNLPFDVVFACPLEDSIWVVDNNSNLYQVSYESMISDIVLTEVEYINMSPEHYTAITTAGELYVWGDNVGCRLGLSDEEYIEKPTKVDYITNAKETAISYGNTIVLLQDGTVYAAGEVYKKDSMELDDNLTGFTLMGELKNVNHLYNSGLCVTQNDNGLKSWSHIYKDFEDNEYKVKPITSVDDFLMDKEPVYCSGGSEFTVYLTESGDVFYWGYDFLVTSDRKCDPYAIPCKKAPYIDEVDMIYSGADVVYAKKGEKIYVIKKRHTLNDFLGKMLN